jgi:hypothetical protein
VPVVGWGILTRDGVVFVVAVTGYLVCLFLWSGEFEEAIGTEVS